MWLRNNGLKVRRSLKERYSFSSESSTSDSESSNSSGEEVFLQCFEEEERGIDKKESWAYVNYQPVVHSYFKDDDWFDDSS